jgi:hypothetical protein
MKATIHLLKRPALTIPILLAVTSALSTNVWAQCSDATTTMYAESTATRLNGNTVRLYNRTSVWGNYYNWWAMYLSSAFFFNGNQQQSYPWGTPSQMGVSAEQTFNPTLQSYGPGQYYTSAVHGAYTPYCNQWVTWQPNDGDPTHGITSNQIQISRPGRPDYQSGYPTLWYLGPGIASDGSYNAQTVFRPGAANGAPESPVYVITSGSNKLSLNCTNCANPTATALAASSGCSVYDVVVNTSYNGFLSDPFFLFINRPWSLIASNDRVYPGWCGPGGGWVYSCPKNNGYATRINYEVKSLCAFDASMTNYHFGEQFTGGWVPDYANENWYPDLIAGPPILVDPLNPTWYDEITVFNDGTGPGDPAYCWVGGALVLCVPQQTNSGAGPHTLVRHALQSWFVGSPVTGGGLKIQTDTLQQYTDSAWHTGIVTPIP